MNNKTTLPHICRDVARRVSTVILLLLLTATLTAQTSNWYIGAKGGTAFGISTFTSFAADKTHIGFGGDLFGGYRINRVLSLELSGGYSQLTMEASSCCAHLWLGSDGERYYAPPLGMDSWSYADIRSSVSLFNAGLHLNVSLLPLFKTQSRFIVELSPAVYYANASADIGRNHAPLPTHHIGAGGDLAVGYQLSPSVALGIYGGAIYYTGKPLDGLPRIDHSENLSIHSGIKFTYSFGKKRKADSRDVIHHVSSTNVLPEQTDMMNHVSTTPSVVATPTPIIVPETTAVTPSRDVVHNVSSINVSNTDGVHNVSSINVSNTDGVHTVSTPITKPMQTDGVHTVSTPAPLPIISFASESPLISNTEMPKVQQIAQHLEANPDFNIEMRGWCNTFETDEQNRKMANDRAIELRYQLIKLGIAGKRMTVRGMSKDTPTETNNAHRVEITQRIEKP